MIRFMDSMKSKITVLIIASVAGLFALSTIQGYLINNTYELRKDAFMEETIEAVTVIDNHLTRIDSMRSEWRDTMLEIVAGHKQGYVTRDSILYYFQLKTDSLNEEFIEAAKEELKNVGFSPSLKFQKKVRSIVILHSYGNDTLYSSKKNQEEYILGEVFTDKGYNVSSSTSYSEYSFDNELDGRKMRDMVQVNFGTETLLSIEGWEREVLGEMKGLLATSIAIFLFVFGVLFYSIKNLITQKKIAEVKTNFINNISHEFKTPLATLTLATGMLKERTGKEQPDLETVEIIDRQNRRLQKLLDQVLDNSLSHNEIELQKKEVEAEHFLTSLLNDFVLSTQGKDVQLRKDLKVGNRKVGIDAFYLTTALLNILENAVKHNNEHVEIDFFASIDENLLITIKDNGIGISSNDQKNLFEKFFRAGNKEIHEVKGLGLGLFYANQIMKAHGGSISVKSRVGQGTTFTIEVPLI